MPIFDLPRRLLEQARKRLHAGLVTPADLDRLYEQLAASIQIQNVMRGDAVFRPMPGWALSPDAIVNILADLQERPSPSLIEFGSGQSTLVFAASVRNRGGRFVSIEHDAAHAAAVRQQLIAHDLQQYVDLLTVAIEEKAAGHGFAASRSYALPHDLGHFDVALVDGPPYFFGEGGRYHPLRWALEHLKPGGAAYLDDMIRSAEQAIVAALKAEWPSLEVQDLATAKGMARLTLRGAA